MTVRRLAGWLFTVGAAAVLLWGMFATPTSGPDPLAIGDKIACPKCEGESIAASQTPTARAMMAVVEERIEEGMSEREILDWFSARYGPDIVLEPPLDLGGLALWAVPLIAVVGGALLAVRTTRRRRDDPAPVPPARRSLAILGITAVILTGAAFGIGRFVQPRAPGSVVSGDLEVDTTTDLDGVTNEEMEAVLEQFADVPEANRMRLALARRYFEEVDYSAAVGHFQQVLSNDPTPVEASEALGRIGWILFVNEETGAAEAAYLQALDALATNGEAKWYYSILLVAEGRGEEAVPLLEELLTDETVPPEVLEEIELLLTEARNA